MSYNSFLSAFGYNGDHRHSFFICTTVFNSYFSSLFRCRRHEFPSSIVRKMLNFSCICWYNSLLMFGIFKKQRKFPTVQNLDPNLPILWQLLYEHPLILYLHFRTLLFIFYLTYHNWTLIHCINHFFALWQKPNF